MSAGNVPATPIIDLAIRINSDRFTFDEARTIPGLVDYVRAQKNAPSLDVVAEFSSMLAAMDGVVSWIIANFPKDAGGFLLRETWGVSGPVDRIFAPAQTAGLRTQLASLIATIA
jgi:hypothetical protein